MHNPSEIEQNQLSLVRFPNLGSDDIIIPGMENLSFNIKLSLMADPKRVLVSNIGRVIVKKLAAQFEGNEGVDVNDFDVFTCYQELWKKSAVRQGIIHGGSCTENCMKL